MVPRRLSGFTLLEIAIAIAIVAILALISIPMYQDYKTRSMATELMIKVDEMRTRLGVVAGTDEWKNKCDVSGAIDKRLLDWPHAKLEISLDASKPPKAVVLGVTSVQGQHHKQGVAIATEAHKQFEKNGILQRTVAINEATAVYAVKLADAPNCAAGDPNAGNTGGGTGTPPGTGSGTPPGTGSGTPPGTGSGNPPATGSGNPPTTTGGNPPANTGTGGSGQPPATGGNPPATGNPGSGNTGNTNPGTGNKPTGTGGSTTPPGSSTPGNSGSGNQGHGNQGHGNQGHGNQGNHGNTNNPGLHKGHNK